jgi:hypothetical protein
MPFPHSIRSLSEVPAFAPLLGVCKEFNVEITAFGSVVRRLATYLLGPSAKESGSMPDLFHLAPFLSDIDLRHPGTAQQTPAIREAIIAGIQHSECFRWDVFSEDGLQLFNEDELHLPVLPANKMSLGTREGRGIDDPFDGADDIRSGKYRMQRNLFYSRSKLRREYRDCELLHALFFLQLILEQEAENPTEQPGWAACCEMITQPGVEGLALALGESSYLRARVGYRLKGMRAACRRASDWKDVTDRSGLRRLMRSLARFLPFWRIFTHARHWLGDLDPPDGHLVSSCRLGGDLFRLDEPLSRPREIEQTAEQVWSQIKETHVPLKALCEYPIPTIAKGQELLAASPPLRFRPGTAPSGNGEEMLCVQLPLRGAGAEKNPIFEDDSLGVLVVLSAETAPTLDGVSRPHSCVLPLPGCCEIQHYLSSKQETRRLLQVRVNCGKLLDVFPDLVSRADVGIANLYRVQIFILRCHE